MPTGQFRWESDLGVGTEALFTGARGAPGRVRKQDVSRVRLVGIASAPRRAAPARLAANVDIAFQPSGHGVP